MSRQQGILPSITEVNKFIHKFPSLEYCGTHIRCIICDIGIVGRDAYNCKQHIKSKRHKANVGHEVPYSKFVQDFIFMSSVCNIPQRLVDNENFRQFWKTYVPSWTLPSRKPLRNQFPRVKATVENCVRCQLRNNKLWLTVHETTDAKRNSVVNVLVRTLNSTEHSHPFLLSSKRLVKNNSEVIVETVRDAIGKFAIVPHQLAILVTDGSLHMIKVGAKLKEYYPNMLHLTCLLQALHLVAEDIKRSYPKIDSLITHTRKVFIKSPKRVREFKNLCLGIPLPPQPTLMRCGTWLEAALYYNKYFEDVKSFILKLYFQECEAVSLSQQLFLDLEVARDVSEISRNYSPLVEAVTTLEKGSLLLSESLNVVNHLKIALEDLTDQSGLGAVEKLDDVLNNSPDFQSVLFINQCISENQECKSNLREYFKFASLTALDVEDSFTKYTKMFSPRRTRFNASTMEGLLMIQFYASSLHESNIRR